MKKSIFFITLLIWVSSSFGVDRLVPDDYATIQDAIKDCVDGDVVIISSGIYQGLGNYEINLHNKAIIVRSTTPSSFDTINNTIIDCQMQGRAFVFNSGESNNSIIKGLTIINGHSLIGGAIYCDNQSDPKISNCVIENNSAIIGGGVACTDGSRPKINSCTIISNSASFGGGGIYSKESDPVINNCIIANNVATTGAGINCKVSNLEINNTTITNNLASKLAGGIYCSGSSEVTIQNSIFWANGDKKGSELYVSNSGGISSLKVLYCDVQQGQEGVVVQEGCNLDWAEYNINADPMLINGPYGGLYLDKESPCVDAGGDFAANLDLYDFTTQMDNAHDSGKVDIGYHYPRSRAIVKAKVDIKPDVLSSANQELWINCSIWLPSGYNVINIDSHSIVLENQIEPAWAWADEERQVIMAKFRYSSLQDKLDSNSISLTVSGQLIDGTIFQGVDEIMVIGKISAKN